MRQWIRHVYGCEAMADCPTHGQYVQIMWAGTVPQGCPTCERERRQRDTQRRNAIRRPPRPPHQGTPGRCALCGTSPLPGRRRSWCSDECVELWHIATSSDTALGHLQALHGAACWDCGRTWEPGVQQPWDLLGYVVEPPQHARWRGASGPHCRIPQLGPEIPHPVKLYVDHRRPLWSLTDEQRQELRWWLPFNLQLLCHTCHTRKTRAEAKERARARRAATPRPPGVP